MVGTEEDCRLLENGSFRAQKTGQKEQLVKVLDNTESFNVENTGDRETKNKTNPKDLRQKIKCSYWWAKILPASKHRFT